MKQVNTSGFGQDQVSSNAVSNPLQTSNGPSSATSSKSTSLTQQLDDLLASLLNATHTANGTSGAASSANQTRTISDVEPELVARLATALGVKDTYSLHLTKLCEGNYVKPPTDNTIIVTSCTDYGDYQRGLRNITSAIPSYFTLNNQTVTVPLVLSMRTALEEILDLATGVSHAMLVMLVMGTLGMGITAVGSGVVLVSGISTTAVWVNVVFGILGSVSLVLFAATATGAVVGGASAMELTGGKSFHVQAKYGIGFLIVAWVLALTSMLCGGHWFRFWFVEFRKTSIDEDITESSGRYLKRGTPVRRKRWTALIRSRISRVFSRDYDNDSDSLF
jgi:hypothetical protein